MKQQNGILLRKCNCDKVTYSQDNGVTIHNNDVTIHNDENEVGADDATINIDDVTINDRTVDDVTSDYVTMGSDILQIRGNNET